jgi:hypothetical protein
MSSSPALEPALLWPMQPGVFPGARATGASRAARAAATAASPRKPRQRSPPSLHHARSRAEAATSAVLAALPRGAKHPLRLSCRSGRAAVDAHARRLEVCHGGHAPLSPAAAARMPLLQELRLSAYNDTNLLALAAGLRALAQGPAQLRRASVHARGRSSALAGVVSAFAGLTALTRLELRFDLDGPQWRTGAAPPLVLPWAHVEVRAAAARGEGCYPGQLRSGTVQVGSRAPHFVI